MLEDRVGEIAEHGFVRRLSHGELMVRAAPQLCFCLMAAGADRAADVGGRRRLGGVRDGPAMSAT